MWKSPVKNRLFYNCFFFQVRKERGVNRLKPEDFFLYYPAFTSIKSKLLESQKTELQKLAIGMDFNSNLTAKMSH